MVTKADIVSLLHTNDRAICRALVVLNDRQTNDEQYSETTRHENGRGFRPCHARMGTSMAKFYQARGYLTERQIAYWRRTQRDGKMRIEIYAGQLLEAAVEKASKVVPAVAAPAPAPTPYKGADVGNMLEEIMVLEEQLASMMRQNASFGAIERVQEQIAFLNKEVSRAYREVR